MSFQEIYIITKSGTAHRAAEDDSGKLATFEGDNLDDARAYFKYNTLEAFEAALLKHGDRASQCHRCFPRATPAPE
jgi:hypothetical protein